MPRPRDPTLRSALLQAAARVFGEGGFAAASVDKVGAAAGVTKGGVYFHFASKEELFLATLEHGQRDLERALDHAEEGLDRGADRLRAVLREWLRFHLAYPLAGLLRRVSLVELRGRFLAKVKEALESPHRALRARLRGMLSAGLADGSLDVADPAQCAFVLAAALEGVLVQRESAPQEVAMFCDADAIADALVSGLVVVIGPERVEPRDRYQPPF